MEKTSDGPNLTNVKKKPCFKINRLIFCLATKNNIIINFSKFKNKLV